MPNYRSFTGHKVHKLDSKNRVSIPANMRSDLGNEFYITLGTDNCLAIRTLEAWDEFMAKLQTLPETQRKAAGFHFVANAENLSLDPNGRIRISDYLRKKVGIDSENEIVIYGASDRIEIWNKDLFYSRLDECGEVDWGSVFDNFGI